LDRWFVHLPRVFPLFFTAKKSPRCVVTGKPRQAGAVPRQKPSDPAGTAAWRTFAAANAASVGRSYEVWAIAPRTLKVNAEIAAA